MRPTPTPEDSLGRMRGISDLTNTILHARKDDLASIPGKGETVLDYGIHRLHRHAAFGGAGIETLNAITEKAYAAFNAGKVLCESPIERAVLAGMITGCWTGFETLPPHIHDARQHRSFAPPGDVTIMPQFAFARYRVDFMIVLRSDDATQMVAVECDGHAYHQDVAKERERDLYFVSWGIPIMRFAGHEIQDDPIACADKVVHYACSWKVKHP